MLDLKALLSKILDALKVDYVVEEGGVGTNATYRKWKSGLAEFWYHVSNNTGVTTSVWVSPIYYMDSSSWANIWAGVFNATPRDVIITSNNSQFLSIYPYAWTVNGISQVRFLSVGAKSSAAYAFSLYAIGTWGGGN